MGAGQSELSDSLRRCEKLLSKPPELKFELSQFVSLTKNETALPIKLNPKLFDVLMKLLLLELESGNSFDVHMLLIAIKRLLKVRTIYTESARSSLLYALVKPLNNSDPMVVQSGLNCIENLIICNVTCENEKEKSKFNEIEAESSVKFAFFEHSGFDALASLLIKYGRTSFFQITNKSLDLLSISIVDRLHTTRFHILQRIVKKLNPHLLLIEHLTISSDRNQSAFACILLSGLLLHSPLENVYEIQNQTLNQGWILHYILFSIDCSSLRNGNYQPAKNHIYVRKQFNESLCKLTRNLLSLLCSGNKTNQECLKNIIPIQLQGSIEEKLQIEGDDNDSQKSPTKFTTKQNELQSNTLWWKFQHNELPRVNCDYLFSNLDDEFKLPHFVWTPRMKFELIEQIYSEILDCKQLSPGENWNWQSFEINYSYLDKYCRVGNFYVSLLKPVLLDPNSTYKLSIPLIHQLLSALFQRSVVETENAEWKLGCLQCITALYNKYTSEFKDFLIIPYYIFLLDPNQLSYNNSSKIIHDHILEFLTIVLKEPINSRRFVKFKGIQVLRYYVNRLHVNTAKRSISKQNHHCLPSRSLELSEETNSNDNESVLSENNQSDTNIDDFEMPQWPFDQNGTLRSPQLPISQKSKISKKSVDLDKQLKSSQSKGINSIVTTNNSSVSDQENLDTSTKDVISPIKDLQSDSTDYASIPPSKTPEAPAKTKLSDSNLTETQQYLNIDTSKDSDWENSDEKESLTSIVDAHEWSNFQVSAMALRSLRIISFNDNRSKRTMTQIGILQTLTDCLLCDSSIIKNETLSLLIDLLSSQPFLIPTLQIKYNLFTILTYVILNYGFSTLLIKLIDLIHLKQTDKLDMTVEDLAQLEIRSRADAAIVNGYNSPPKGNLKSANEKSPNQVPSPTPIVQQSKASKSANLEILTEPTKKIESAFTPFFPASIVHLLTSRGATEMAKIFTSKINEPTVIWNNELANDARNSINERVEPYREQLSLYHSSSDEMLSPKWGDQDFTKIKPVSYPSLSNELFIGGIYLRPLNEMAISDLSSVQLSQPDYTMQELIKTHQYYTIEKINQNVTANLGINISNNNTDSLNNNRSNLYNQLIQILMSEAIIVSRYPSLYECKNYPSFEFLLSHLQILDKQSYIIDEKFDLLTAASQLMNALLLIGQTNAETCFNEKGLEIIQSLLLNVLKIYPLIKNGEINQNSSDNQRNIEIQSSGIIEKKVLSLIQVKVHLLACLGLLCHKTTSALKHIEHNIELFSQLIYSLIDYQNESLSICLSILQFLTNLISNPKLFELQLRFGILPIILDIILKSEIEIKEFSNPHNSSITYSQLKLSAIETLKQLIQQSNSEKLVVYLNSYLNSNIFNSLIHKNSQQILELLNNSIGQQSLDQLGNYCKMQINQLKLTKNHEWDEWENEKPNFEKNSPSDRLEEEESNSQDD